MGVWFRDWSLRFWSLGFEGFKAWGLGFGAQGLGLGNGKSNGNVDHIGVYRGCILGIDHYSSAYNRGPFKDLI